MPWFCRLCARRLVGLHGHLPSLGSCARRVGDVPRGSQYHLRRPRTARRGRALLVCARLHRFLFISLKIERRFMRRVAHRVRPGESGCPIHKKQLLPVLVVWAPPRKKRNQEQHTLNGSTSPSADGSPLRSVRQRVDLRQRRRALGAAADRPRSSLGTSLHARQGVGGHPWRWASSRPPKRTDGTS